MSYEHGTPFLNLAQTIGTDHRDWVDENEAKLDLDTKMKTLWDGAADTATILSTLQENVATLQTDVTTLEGVVSGHSSTITTINESLVLINTALNALNTQVINKFDSAGIADPYDASYGIYSVGDVVTYNGQRYVCSTAVTAAEPFDVSKWTAEDVQSVLSSLTDGVSTLTSNRIAAGVDISNYTISTTNYQCPSDGYISLTAAASSTVRCRIYGADSASFMDVKCLADEQNDVFVKKGMYVGLIPSGSTGTYTAEFHGFY